MSGGSKLVGAPQALYVLGELLFELATSRRRPPGWVRPLVHRRTPTAAAARVIV